MAKFSDLSGKKIISVEGLKKESHLVYFKTSDGNYMMLHEQECCEDVYVEDVIGDVADLQDAVVISAEEVNDADQPDNYEGPEGECPEWTFYNIQTNKGHVTIRWFGDSNGYYSTSVSFIKKDT